MNEIREIFPKSKIAESFKPVFGLRNAHAQTILSSVGPRKAIIAKRFAKFRKHQQSMLLNGGDGVRLEGYYNRAGEEVSDKLAILIHGWEGCHDSTYMQSMAIEFLDNGIDVFRLNLRDHGDTHHLNREIFNSTLVGEVINAIEDLQSRLPYPEYHLVGFSLGGNFCLRVSAMAHEHEISLTSVVAFCPVLHAASSNVVLNQTANFCLRSILRAEMEAFIEKKTRALA